MKDSTAVKLVICLFAVGLAGCGQVSNFWTSPEEKINAAFPLAESAQYAKSSLLKELTNDNAKDVEAQFASRLKVRALTCAKGYSPNRFSSASDIRKRLESNTCFVESDNEIRKWLGLMRAGLLLAKPALRTTSKNQLGFLVADDFISGTRFAEEAAVAALQTQKTVSFVDFESTKPIFRGPNDSALGAISPNGRLFVTADGNGDVLKIREVESGAVVTEIPFVRAFQFKWLDARTAIYISREKRTTHILDFTTAREVQVLGVANGFDQAVRVVGSDDQYVLMGGSGVSKIQLIRNRMEPEVKLISEKPISGLSCALNTSGKTADGLHYFCVGENLKIVNLATMEVQIISFDPFRVQIGITTPNPDQILLRGYTQPSQGEDARYYLYSIRDRTLAQINRDKSLPDRFEHIGSINQQAVINQSRVEVLRSLSTLSPIPLDKFVVDAQEFLNLRKLAAFEKQAATSGGGSTSEPLASNVLAKGPLVDLARDAQIEGIGVYQGNGSGSQRSEARSTGYVEVRIRRSTKPIILVLSSYEPVRWMLVSEPGARLAGVLVSGYYPSQVVGAGSAPVIVSGSSYAYKVDSPQYRALNQSVANATGKEIGLFQGRYDGGQFSVGAVSRW